MMLVITGMSGSGKTTIVRYLVNYKGFKLIKIYSDRPARRDDFEVQTISHLFPEDYDKHFEIYNHDYCFNIPKDIDTHNYVVVVGDFALCLRLKAKLKYVKLLMIDRSKKYFLATMKRRKSDVKERIYAYEIFRRNYLKYVDWFDYYIANNCDKEDLLEKIHNIINKETLMN